MRDDDPTAAGQRAWCGVEWAEIEEPSLPTCPIVAIADTQLS